MEAIAITFGQTLSDMTFGLLKKTAQLFKLPFNKRNKIAAEKKKITEKERKDYYQEELRKYNFSQKTKKENELKKEQNNLRITIKLLKKIDKKMREIEKSTKINEKQLKQKNLSRTIIKNRKQYIWNNNFNLAQLKDQRSEVLFQITDLNVKICQIKKKVSEHTNVTFTGEEPIWNCDIQNPIINFWKEELQE